MTWSDPTQFDPQTPAHWDEYFAAVIERVIVADAAGSIITDLTIDTADTLAENATAARQAWMKTSAERTAETGLPDEPPTGTPQDVRAIAQLQSWLTNIIETPWGFGDLGVVDHEEVGMAWLKDPTANIAAIDAGMTLTDAEDMVDLTHDLDSAFTAAGIADGFRRYMSLEIDGPTSSDGEIGDRAWGPLFGGGPIVKLEKTGATTWVQSADQQAAVTLVALPAGTAQHGDVFGPWLLEDLKALCQVLTHVYERPTSLLPTHASASAATTTFTRRVGVSGWVATTAGAISDAKADADASTSTPAAAIPLGQLILQAHESAGTFKGSARRETLGITLPTPAAPHSWVFPASASIRLFPFGRTTQSNWITGYSIGAGDPRTYDDVGVYGPGEDEAEAHTLANPGDTITLDASWPATPSTPAAGDLEAIGVTDAEFAYVYEPVYAHA